MSYSNNSKQKETATVADASSAGDKLTFTPAVPAEILEFGLIVTTALVDAAGGMVMSVDKRPTAGSDSGRGDGDLGVMTLTSAQANKAAGKVVKSRPASPGVVYPGQQAMLELNSTAPDSGAGIAFLVWREAFAGDQTNETVVAA